MTSNYGAKGIGIFLLLEINECCLLIRETTYSMGTGVGLLSASVAGVAAFDHGVLS